MDKISQHRLPQTPLGMEEYGFDYPLKAYKEPARALPIIDEADVFVRSGRPGGMGAEVVLKFPIHWSRPRASIAAIERTPRFA